MAHCKIIFMVNLLRVFMLSFDGTVGYILQSKLQELGLANFTNFAEPLHGNIPDKLDWRLHLGVTSVRDQGVCAACWAFSIIGCIESQILIYHKSSLDLSEQMLIDCADNGGCSNGSLITGFSNLINNLGGTVVNERDYRYTNRPTAGRCKDYSNMGKISVMGYRRVIPDEEQIRQYVANVGPLAAAINSKSMLTYPNNSGWIDVPKDCNPKELDHTVLIVGYGTFESAGVDMPFWIIKNSWGTSWGQEGFYFLQRGQNACGIESDVVYGVVA